MVVVAETSRCHARTVSSTRRHGLVASNHDVVVEGLAEEHVRCLDVIGVIHSEESPCYPSSLSFL